MVASSSGAEQVPDESAFGTAPNQQGYPIVKTDLPVTKNGYLYVYVSNETPNIDVFFDNLQVTHIKGQILEETHYYPFGLTMAGISDKAAGGLENRYKYNGKELQHNEFSDGSGLEEYDFGARMQDPQLGRFASLDPHADNYANQSPYNYVFNMPVIGTDPTGMDTHLEGYEAQDAFMRLQRSNSFDINTIDNIAQTVKDQTHLINVDESDKSTNDNHSPISIAVANFFTQRSDTTRPNSGSGGGAFGTGVQLSVGLGAGKNGTVITAGEFGSSSIVHTFFITVSEPSKKTGDVMLDLSLNAQFLFGYSKSGKFNLNEPSKTIAGGVGPFSMSYNTDDLIHPTYFIVGGGPGLGIEATASPVNTKTVVSFPVITGFMPF